MREMPSRRPQLLFSAITVVIITRMAHFTPEDTFLRGLYRLHFCIAAEQLHFNLQGGSIHFLAIL
jgi:hypothetical protein